MTYFRPFRNSDPPLLADVWRSQPSQRGLMQPMSAALLEQLVLSKPVFEREGLIVATPWFGDKPDPKVKAFVQKYEKTFGKKPDQFAAQAYDALYIMAEALKKAGKADRDKLRDALAGIRNFNGVLGKFSFDAERDVVMEPNVLVIKGGKFQLFN